MAGMNSVAGDFSGKLQAPCYSAELPARPLGAIRGDSEVMQSSGMKGTCIEECRQIVIEYSEVHPIRNSKFAEASKGRADISGQTKSHEGLHSMSYFRVTRTELIYFCTHRLLSPFSGNNGRRNIEMGYGRSSGSNRNN